MDQGFCEEVVLRGEVLVHGAECHSGCLGHILHLNLLEGSPPRQLKGGIDDPVPPGPLRLGQFTREQSPGASNPAQRRPLGRTDDRFQLPGLLRNCISSHGIAFEQEIG